MNWMLGLGLVCLIAGTAILTWQLYLLMQQLGKKIPHRWKKWRVISEKPGTTMFYVVLVLVLSISFLVLGRVYS